MTTVACLVVEIFPLMALAAICINRHTCLIVDNWLLDELSSGKMILSKLTATGLVWCGSGMESGDRGRGGEVEGVPCPHLPSLCRPG